MVINIEPTLQAKLEEISQSLSRPIDELVNEAVSEYLNYLVEQQLDAEIKAFERMHPDLRAKYVGQFVAIHQGQVVDTDPDFEQLFTRIQSRFGDQTVLIREVGPTPDEEWHFRSPRLEQA